MAQSWLTHSAAEGYTANHDETPVSPRSSISSEKTKKKIPPRIVQNAVGLAVFSCMRSGLWKSGSGGSGILVARKSDGQWSPPSGLLLHTAALGFVIGVDVYDCVLVINSTEDLETFTRPQTTLGADVELAVGPVMPANHLENEVPSHELGRTVLTYVKARGEHRAVNIDGSLVSERAAENHRFYDRSASVLDILAGQVPPVTSPEITMLYEVIKSAEGRVDFDAQILERLALQPAPGDAMIESPSSLLSPPSPGRLGFGMPSVEDPDPFGVKALEMAGLEIREAGTKERPPSSQFEYNPSPTSPFFTHFNRRQSTDTYNTQSNSTRASYMSNKSNKTSLSRMTDACTQTTIDTRGTTPTSEDGHDRTSVDRLPVVLEPEEVDYTHVDDSASKRWSQEQPGQGSGLVASEAPAVGTTEIERGHQAAGPDAAPKNTHGEDFAIPSIDERDEDADDEDDESDGQIGVDAMDENEDDEDDEDEFGDEPVVFEVYEAKAIQPARTAIMSSQVTQITHAKGALVNIPKRAAPPVPPRSPRRSSKSDFGDLPPKSPLRNSFQSTASRRMSGDSANGAELLSMDGVMNSGPARVVASVTPASPARHDAETPESENRQSGESHRESIYTTIMERRLSMDDTPKTPSTLQTSGHTSSGDEQEPRTPKPEDEVIAPIEDEAIPEKVALAGARRNLIVESN